MQTLFPFLEKPFKPSGLVPLFRNHTKYIASSCVFWSACSAYYWGEGRFSQPTLASEGSPIQESCVIPHARETLMKTLYFISLLADTFQYRCGMRGQKTAWLTLSESLKLYRDFILSHRCWCHRYIHIKSINREKLFFDELKLTKVKRVVGIHCKARSH